MVSKRRTIPDIAYFLEPLAQVAVHEGDLRRAARLLGASQALRQQIGIPGPPVERAGIENCRNLLEQALSLDDFTRELTAGESLNAEKAVELALEGWQGSAALSDILSG